MVKLKEQLRNAKNQANKFEAAPATRKRHVVVGNKQRGKPRSQLQANSDAHRKDTLLVEYQQRHKTSTFVDGRFGEDDAGMPSEDKAVARFQRERQRQLKQSRYGLDEAGGASGGHDGQSLGAATQLTHGGRSLGDMEDMSDIEADSDDERGGGGPRNRREEDDFVRKAHFGGGELGEGERRLTQKELLEETIAKYKLQKYERQEVKSAEQQQISKLDVRGPPPPPAMFARAQPCSGSGSPRLAPPNRPPAPRPSA